MALRLQELQQREAITNQDGTPSQYFLRYLKDRGGSLTDLEAQLVLLLSRQIIAGTGLTGGGALEDGDVTLSADAQAILDEIAASQGSLLFRGATGWEVLGPGAAGDVLQTNGTSADPSWETPTTGGGGGGGGLIHAAPIPRGTTVSNTGQASKGIQFYAELGFDVYGVRTCMTEKTGATYQATLWTLSGGNLGTQVASTPSWVGAANADKTVEATFTGGPYTLTADTTYVVLVTATSEISTYALPLYSTNSGSYFSNLPARSVVYARIATNAPSTGAAVSTSSGNYSVALIADAS